MAEPYSVRGTRVNVVAVLRQHGLKFHLSRPVEIDGQRRRSGWMLSHDGKAVVMLHDCDVETAKKVCQRHLSKAGDRAELERAIAKTVAEHTDTELSVRAV